MQQQLVDNKQLQGILRVANQKCTPVLLLLQALLDNSVPLVRMRTSSRPVISGPIATFTHLPPPEPILAASSKHFRRPSPDSDVTNTSSEDDSELLALPGLPPSKNLSHYVQRAKRQFKPYDKQGHGPNAIELRFFHKSVGTCSSETDMTLADVQAGKELFERGLRGMSSKAVTQAAVAMQAT
ncbi:hypothetical protein BDR04DRAFT_1123514, partial [Suillus decipiens]